MKSKVKSGYVVELRRGTKMLTVAVEFGLILLDPTTNNWYRLNEFTDSLEYNHLGEADRSLDIMRIWGRINHADGYVRAWLPEIRNRDLLYDRMAPPLTKRKQLIQAFEELKQILDTIEIKEDGED